VAATVLNADQLRRGTSGPHAAGMRAQVARQLRHDYELLALLCSVLPREGPRMTPHGGGQLSFHLSSSYFFLSLPS